MRTVTDSEIEDYEAAICGAGLKVEDFELKEADHTPLHSGEMVAINGSVTVTHKKTAKSLVYGTGHGSRWPFEFEMDLRAGKYNNSR